jgi:hypothetical protein
MMKKTILVIISLFIQVVMFGQCSNFAGVWPTGTQNTTSNSLVTATTCAYGGEYATYAVTSGETYTWTTCGDTDFDTQLTLWNTAHTVSYAYNDDNCGLQSTITWLATFTGNVHVLLSEYNCGSNATCMTVQWACTTCGVMAGPGADCANAITLTPGVQQCGVNSSAGSFPDGGGAPTNPCNGLYNDGEYWFEYTATGDQLVLDVSGLTDTYSGVFVLDACPGAGPNCVASFTNGASTANYSLTTPMLTPGQTYYIVIANWSAPYSTAFCLDATGQAPPPATAQECFGGSTVCNDSQLSGNSSGFGVSQELNGANQGCMTTEHQSSWYLFSAQTAGSFAFTISPTNGTDDYDFAIWGPYPSGSTASTMCPPSVAPMLCSWAGGAGNTGLADGSGDLTEGAGGDGFVEDIVANAGDTYVLLIDNFSSTASPFDLTWSISGGGSLDCALLPIVLGDFDGAYLPLTHENVLEWNTLSESNTDYFRIEKSTNGIDFSYLTKVKAAGNSSAELNYRVKDDQLTELINYYKLYQTDLDGIEKHLGTIQLTSEVEVSVFPNPVVDFVDINLKTVYKDLVVEVINIEGKTVMTDYIENDKSLVRSDLSALNPGFYFIKVSSKYGVVLLYEKIVKE